MVKGNPRTRLDNLEENIAAISEKVDGQPDAIINALKGYIDEKMTGIYQEAASSVESKYIKTIEEKDQENKRLKSELETQNARIDSLQVKLNELPSEDYINQKIDDLNKQGKRAGVRLYRKAIKSIEDRTENALNSLSFEIDSKFESQEDLLNIILSKHESIDALLENGEKFGERLSKLLTQVYKRESRRETKTQKFIEQIEELNAEAVNSVDMIVSTAESAAETKESIEILGNEFRSLASEAEQTKDKVRSMLSGAESKIIGQWQESQREINSMAVSMTGLVNDHLSNHSQKYDNQLAKIEAVADSVKSLVFGVQKTQDNIDNSSVSLATSVEGLKGDMSELKTLKVMPSQLKTLNTAMMQISDTFQLVMQADEETGDE